MGPLRELLRVRGRPALPERPRHGHPAQDGHLLRLHAALLPVALPGALRPAVDGRPPPLRLQPPESPEEGQVSAPWHATAATADSAERDGRIEAHLVEVLSR